MDTSGSPPAQQVSGTVVFDEGGDELPEELPPAPQGGEGDEATPTPAGAAGEVDAAKDPMAGSVEVTAPLNPGDKAPLADDVLNDADQLEAGGETADPAVAADAAVDQQQGDDVDPAAGDELPPELPQSPPPAAQESEPEHEPETAKEPVEGSRLPGAPEPEPEPTLPLAETTSEAEAMEPPAPRSPKAQVPVAPRPPEGPGPARSRPGSRVGGGRPGTADVVERGVSSPSIGGMSVSSQEAAHSEVSGNAPATSRPRNMLSRGGIVSTGNDGLNLPGSAVMATAAKRNQAAGSFDHVQASSKMFHVERWIENEGQFLAGGVPPEDQGPPRQSITMPRLSQPGGAKAFGFSLESSTQRRVNAQEVREMAVRRISGADSSMSGMSNKKSLEEKAAAAARMRASLAKSETPFETVDGVPTKDHSSLAFGAAAGTGVGGAETGLVDVVATNGGGNDTSSAKEAMLPQGAVSMKNAMKRISSLNFFANAETDDEGLDGKRLVRQGSSMKLLSRVLSKGGVSTQEIKKKKGSGILKQRDRKDTVFQKVKNRRKVHFQLETTVKKGAGALTLLAYAVNPTVNAYVISIHVMMLTYESWAIPFRLSLMHRWHWVDVSMDAVALLSLMHALMVAVSSDYERAHNMRRSGITLFSDSDGVNERAHGGGYASGKVNVNSYLEAIGAKTPKKDKKHEKRKKKKKRDSMLGDPLYAELTVAQLKHLPYALMVCASLYTSEIFRVLAPEYALMIFYLSALVRCSRMLELWNFFRKKEMDLHTNMRRVAFLKFFIMVFGLSHATGCLSYFLARLSKFTGKDLNVTWVAQYKEYNPGYDFNYNEHLTLHESAKVYLLIVYTGFNGLTNMGYEMTDPQRWEEMVYCIAVVFMQIVLEAFILGTLFHYIVKKDQAVENFRKRLVWATRVVATEALLC